MHLSGGVHADFEPLSGAFNLCVTKARSNIKRLADEPKSAAWAVNGDFFSFKEGFFDIGNWTSSFFTGMALIAWTQTEDEYFLNEVLRLAPYYQQKVFSRHLDTHHDLGFLYSLYSVALYKLTGDKQHREIGLRAAEVLAKRFNEKGNFIRAWGQMNTAEFDNMAIIDSLMNLPLLFWASQESGNPAYRNIAIRHADMALKTFVRADRSVYHAYRFDLTSGAPVGGDTFGGCAVESQWARGAAWAIYGFALSYKYTQEKNYLDASWGIARNFIANLDEENVPVWDFKLPPSARRLRDASAASVAVCGLQELCELKKGEEDLKTLANRLLQRLCSADYLDYNEQCCGIQRNGQVGDGVKGGAQNAFTSWGDYFLMEALARNLFSFVPWW